MLQLEIIASIVIKALKLIINLVILILYRVGNGGEFLGIGGTWNLNEEKSADCEIVASGVMVGFFIYTAAHTISYLFGVSKYKNELSDTIMNVVGVLMWVAVGGTALHYWNGYRQDDYSYLTPNPYKTSERTFGIALGALCIFEAALYLLDTVLSCLHYSKGDSDYVQ